MSDQTRLLIVEDVPQVAQYIRGLLNTQSAVKILDVLSDGGIWLARLRTPSCVIAGGCASKKAEAPNRSARARVNQFLEFLGQTTPWSFLVTAASPLYMKRCTRCPR